MTALHCTTMVVKCMTMKFQEMKATLPTLEVSQQFAAHKKSDIKKTSPFAFSNVRTESIVSFGVRWT